jgi:hypothetical protein
MAEQYKYSLPADVRLSTNLLVLQCSVLSFTVEPYSAPADETSGKFVGTLNLFVGMHTG